MQTKTCSKCSESKTLDKFGKAAKEKSGLKSACKDCLNQCYREYVAANPEKRKQTTREYHKRNADKINAYSRQWYANNLEKAKLTRKSYVERNKEKVKADTYAYQKANKERLKDAARIWRKNNPNKVKATADRHRQRHHSVVLAQGAAWRRANRHKVNAKKSQRITDQLNATPKWANKFFIDEIYELAQTRTAMSGFEWHVDHIVPIRSEIVCGLHCESNLQVIPGIENQRKSNRQWPDMP